jgi:hypothetical protein
MASAALIKDDAMLASHRMSVPSNTVIIATAIALRSVEFSSGHQGTQVLQHSKSAAIWFAWRRARSRSTRVRC